MKRSLVLVPLLLMLTGAAMADTFDVSIGDHFFDPDMITISVGDRIRWTNNGSTTHRVLSNDGLWDSGVLNPGQTYTRTFNDAGSFDYYDPLHVQATGTIEVDGSAIDESSWGWLRYLFSP